jgi:hypothetical protein
VIEGLWRDGPKSQTNTEDVGSIGSIPASGNMAFLGAKSASFLISSFALDLPSLDRGIAASLFSVCFFPKRPFSSLS